MTRMLIFGSIAILGLASFAHSAGENVIVNLSNGDRLSGTLISETDGEVTIEEEDGERYTLRAGDFVHFPLGLKAKWHVPKYVKKTFTLRTLEPLKL